MGGRGVFCIGQRSGRRLDQLTNVNTPSCNHGIVLGDLLAARGLFSPDQVTERRLFFCSVSAFDALSFFLSLSLFSSYTRSFDPPLPL